MPKVYTNVNIEGLVVTHLIDIDCAFHVQINIGTQTLYSLDFSEPIRTKGR